MSKLTLCIDSGHGGMIGNQYMTPPDKGRFFKYPDFTIYEGVINRLIKNQVINLFKAWQFSVVDICPTELDLSISTRKAFINKIHTQLGNTVALSLHSNGGGGHGYELFTTVGDTPADPLAEKLAERIIGDFPRDRFRKNTQTKLGKEHDYGILKCIPPAILLESLFFDNYEDAKKLMSQDYRNRIAETIVDWFNEIKDM